MVSRFHLTLYGKNVHDVSVGAGLVTGVSESCDPNPVSEQVDGALLARGQAHTVHVIFLC